MKSEAETTPEVKEDRITAGLKAMREYYRSHFLKYLKSISATKTLIIEPSLMNIVVDILTREERVPDSCRLVGIAELIGDKRINMGEAQAAVFIVRPELSSVQTVIDQFYAQAGTAEQSYVAFMPRRTIECDELLETCPELSRVH